MCCAGMCVALVQCGQSFVLLLAEDAGEGSWPGPNGGGVFQRKIQWQFNAAAWPHQAPDHMRCDDLAAGCGERGEWMAALLLWSFVQSDAL
eukprot:12887627-Prorocentrum_lima.AAC.1